MSGNHYQVCMYILAFVYLYIWHIGISFLKTLNITIFKKFSTCRDVKSGRSGRYICAIFFQLVLIFGNMMQIPALSALATGAWFSLCLQFGSLGVIFYQHFLISTSAGRTSRTTNQHCTSAVCYWQ